MGLLGVLALAVGLALLSLFAFLVLLTFFAYFRGAASSQSGGKLRVAFVHPDLGIGGAERLVVDAAVALKSAGHTVVLYTARHERDHCFEETRDGTLTVVVYGDFLPRMILGRFYAACAYFRMCWVSLRIALLQFAPPYDVLIVDQVSICLPVLMFARARGIIFYCHYPDKLLTGRETPLKKLYRAPLDYLEETTTGMADQIFVNSHFTAGVFKDNFQRLRERGVKPDVLYPALNLEDQDKTLAKAEDDPSFLTKGEHVLLSINRFERKKNVGLAIQALALLPEATRNSTRLILAGGYDERLPENVEHAAELEGLAKELGVADRVTQMRSISAVTKSTLLKHATCLLYTPDKEHLGIVPLEAMYARLPVIAMNSGGPKETVVEGETGFLRAGDPKEWAVAVEVIFNGGADLRKRFGDAGRRRVTDRFSLKAFGATLDAAAVRLARGGLGKAAELAAELTAKSAGKKWQ